MVVHIKHNKGTSGTTKVVETRVVEKQTEPDKKMLLHMAKEMAAAMAKELAPAMAKEMAKELIANMPAQKIVEIRKEGGKQEDDLIAIDSSVADVTGEGQFKKNFESLGKEKMSADSGEAKRKKLEALKKKK
jgi:hypothetical protein